MLRRLQHLFSLLVVLGLLGSCTTLNVQGDLWVDSILYTPRTQTQTHVQLYGLAPKSVSLPTKPLPPKTVTRYVERCPRFELPTLPAYPVLNQTRFKELRERHDLVALDDFTVDFINEQRRVLIETHARINRNYAQYLKACTK